MTGHARGGTLYGRAIRVGRDTMSALISWVCRVDHAFREDAMSLPAVTIHKGAWAFCVAGGEDPHTWQAIEPKSVEQLRIRLGPFQVLSEEPAARRAG